jgi:GntR family transcriptional regulator, negative regulator for fad regulon and positive regulator of fabA
MEIGIIPPVRPALHVEQLLVTRILDGTLLPGSALPNERDLAKQMGVTRPTLREILQRLANEGWLTIRHGKSTVVNDYWKKGGLGLLGTMARYGENLSDALVTNLLEVRTTLLPDVAAKAVENERNTLVAILKQAEELDEDPEAFAEYDWGLQSAMAEASGNPIYRLILNDFGPVFNILAVRYFGLQKARDASRKYYGEVLTAIESKTTDLKRVVRSMMEQSIELWAEAQDLPEMQ